MGEPPDATIRWRLLPKQEKFLRATEREVLYSGAFGAGKTRAVCMRAVMRASRPGAVEGLCRKHLANLKRTTLRSLLEPEPGVPAVLPAGSYEHRIGEQRILLNGGGQIQYFGFGEGESAKTKIGSLLLSGCGVDEAAELTKSDWTMLRGRLRLPVPGLSGQLYAACNPASPSHHLAVRFGLDRVHKPWPGCLAIRTRSADNHYLPIEYLEDLATFVGVARARYVEGLWVGAEGLVYDRWDRQVFVRHREGPWARIVIGVDEGYRNPAVLLSVCMDEEGRVHVDDEWYKRKQLEGAVVAEAQRFRDRYGPEAFVPDPSAAKLAAAMRAAGLPLGSPKVPKPKGSGGSPGTSDVFGGIQAVQGLLHEDADGPWFTVDPRCENLIREFETYEWMPSQQDDQPKDKPRKAYDHAMDALRYAVLYLVGRPPLEVRLIGGEPAREDVFTEERGWRT